MAENRCPFCGGVPQLSMLHGAGGPLEGGGRVAPLRDMPHRVAVPPRAVRALRRGGRAQARLLSVARVSIILRIDACDTCRHYLKTVDLTRLGIAVPLVDEVAGAPLDVWAREQGYQKIELNLVGL